MARHAARGGDDRIGGRPMKKSLITFGICAALTLSACGTARRSEALGNPVAVDMPALQRGQAVFMQYCNQCHPRGDGGLGPAINDKPLPGFMLRLQVRTGIGAMPSFSEEDISDAELDDLIAYIKAARAAGGGDRSKTTGG